jgi:CRISPR-associated protein Cas2
MKEVPMVVVILDKASESMRGELTKWMLEVKAGIFIGSVSAVVRDLLWVEICTKKMNGGIMVYSAKNEQGFELRMHGNPKRAVIDMEGINLIKVMNK